MKEVKYKGVDINIYDIEDCKNSSILVDIYSSIDLEKDIVVQKHMKI